VKIALPDQQAIRREPFDLKRRASCARELLRNWGSVHALIEDDVVGPQVLPTRKPFGEGGRSHQAGVTLQGRHEQVQATGVQEAVFSEQQDVLLARSFEAQTVERLGGEEAGLSRNKHNPQLSLRRSPAG